MHKIGPQIAFTSPLRCFHRLGILNFGEMINLLIKSIENGWKPKSAQFI